MGLTLAGLFQLSAQTTTWSGAGGDDFWSNAGNWSAGVPTTTSDVIFSDTDKTTFAVPNSVLNSSLTINSLTFNNVGQGSVSVSPKFTPISDWQTLAIDSGNTLSITSTATSPILRVGTSTAANLVTQARITGAGTLTLNDVNGSLWVANGYSVAGGAVVPSNRAVLDMATLATFNATLGQFLVGTAAGGATAGTAGLTSPTGLVKLARTNSITATTIAVGATNSGSNTSSTLQLGASNTLNADNFYVGAAVTSGVLNVAGGNVLFNPDLAPDSSNVATIRATAGGSNRVTNFAVAQHGTVSTGGSVVATVDFSGGSVDAMINNLTIGDGRANAASVRVAGSYIMDEGITDATTVIAGRSQTGSANTTPTAGNILVGGGAFKAGSVTLATNQSGGGVTSGYFALSGNSVAEITGASGLVMGSRAGTATVVTPILNISSGSLTMTAGGIAEGTGGANITSVVSLNGGTLDMVGHSIAVDTLNLNGGTLKNVAGITTTAGTGLRKTTGGGVLTLSGSNSFSGGVTVSSGTVLLDGLAALPVSSTITLNSGGAIALNTTGVQTLIASIASGAAGSVALTTANASEAVDFSGSNVAGAYLGAVDKITYAGSFTPNGSVYRLGGGSGELTYSPNITSGSVEIGGGAGTVILSGANTYTGGTVIKAATLQLTALDDIGGASSDGALSFDGGALQWASGFSGDITANSRAVTFTSNGTLDTNGNNVTLASALAGSGSLIKTGAGALTLSGTNFGGGVAVNKGTLSLGTGSLSGASLLTLGGGTLNVPVTQTLGNVTIAANSGSGIILPSGSTLTLGNTWTRGAGGTVFVDRSGGGTLTSQPIASAGSQATTTTVLPYVIVKDSTGTGYGVVISNNIVRYTAASNLGTTFRQLSNAGTINYRVSTTTTALNIGNSGNAAGMSLQFDNSAAGVMQAQANDLYRFGNASVAGSFLMTGIAPYEFQGGNIGTLNSTEFIVNQYGLGSLTIGSLITSNQAGPSVAFTKTGSGELIMTNSSNNFVGGMVITGGTVSTTSLALGGFSSAIGASTNAAANLVLNGGTLQYTGLTPTTTDRNFTVGANGGTILSNGIGALNWMGDMTASATSGSQTFTLGGANTKNNTFSGLISDGIGSVTSFNKTGLGKWVLTGASDYTGSTTISAGDLVQAGSFARTSDVTLQSSGSLTLNYDAATIGSNSSKINDQAVLRFAGGSLILSGGSHAEVVKSTTVAAGASSVRRTSGSSTIGLNAVTALSGGTVNFEAAGLATTDSNNTNGILGGWATVGGTDWATSVNSGAADTAITKYTGYTALATAGTNTANALISGSADLTGDLTTNSIKISGSGSGNSLDLGTHAATLSSGGLLVTGSGDYSIVNGTLKSGTAGNSDLVVQQYGSGNVTIGATIADGNGASTLTKSGSGKLSLTGSNTYSGQTYVNSGALNVQNSSALGTTTGGTTVASGATLELQNNVTVGAEALSLAGFGTANSGALRNVSGSNQFGGAINLAANSGIRSDADTLTLTGSITGNGNALTFTGAGAVSATGTTSGVSKITKNDAGALTLGDVVLADSLYWDGSGSGTIGGVLSGSGAFIKNGSGSATLAGSNTYVGATAVNAGGLTLNYGTNNTSKLADSSVLALSGGDLILSGGSHAEAVGSTTIGQGASTISRSSGTATIALGGLTNATLGGTLNIGAASIASTTSATANVTVNSVSTATNILGGWLTVGGTNWAAKSGNNIIALSTYGSFTTPSTSATNVLQTGSGSLTGANYAYTAKFDTSGAGQSLDLAGGSLNLASGGLLFVGADDYTIGTGAASNVGTITTNTFNTSAGGTNNSVYIHQNGTGTLTIGSTISNGLANTTTGNSLVKTGSGKLVLTGTNTYSGNTYINGGTLSISSESNILTASDGLLTGLTYGANSTSATSTMTSLPADLIVGTSQIIINNGISYNATVTGISGTSGNYTITLSQNWATGAGSNVTNGYANNPGSLYIDDGVLEATGTFGLQRNVYLGGNGSGIAVTGSNVLTLAGTVADNATGGSGSLTKTGTGTLALNGANLYTGATTVNEGKIVAGAANTAFGINSAVSVANGATVDFGGFSQTVGSLSNVGASGGSVLLGIGTITTGADNSDTKFSGVISGSGGLVKNGTGTFIANGANTYTGTTNVNSGTLLLSDGVTSGSLASSSVTVASGATLGGSGTISGSVVIQSGGRLAPGNSPGLMTVGSLSLASGSTLSMELNGATAGTQYDQIATSGAISLDGDLQLALNFVPTGQSFTLINNLGVGAITGVFASINGSAFGLGNAFSLFYNDVNYDFTLSYTGGDGNDLVIQAVPEPSTWLLIALGGVCLFVFRRRAMRA